MKVVVTGATGNVGTSTIEALAAMPEVERIVGLARRRPIWEAPKTEWVDADVVDASLAPIFEGADAVIHLAWAIQPSHDMETLERINVDGSRRVFQAAVVAGVPKLVYASSVGAYSRGPKDRLVDESWPTEGTESSFYSRHKVATERPPTSCSSASPGAPATPRRRRSRNGSSSTSAPPPRSWQGAGIAPPARVAPSTTSPWRSHRTRSAR
jgi:nucleoside-diphosphate-sugar epimerase